MTSPQTNSNHRRGFFRVLFLAGILGSITSCFSFRVTVPADPECVVGTLAIVHSEPSALDFEKPVSDEPVTATDPGVYSLVKVLQVSKPLKLQWLWYSPANQLVRRSKTVEINAKSKYLAYFAAWDMLSQTYFSDKKGAWTVVITIDGNFLARKEFAVN